MAHRAGQSSARAVQRQSVGSASPTARVGDTRPWTNTPTELFAARSHLLADAPAAVTTSKEIEPDPRPVNVGAATARHEFCDPDQLMPRPRLGRYRLPHSIG